MIVIERLTESASFFTVKILSDITETAKVTSTMLNLMGDSLSESISESVHSDMD